MSRTRASRSFPSADDSSSCCGAFFPEDIPLSNPKPVSAKDRRGQEPLAQRLQLDEQFQRQQVRLARLGFLQNGHEFGGVAAHRLGRPGISATAEEQRRMPKARAHRNRFMFSFLAEGGKNLSARRKGRLRLGGIVLVLGESVNPDIGSADATHATTTKKMARAALLGFGGFYRFRTPVKTAE